MYLLKIIEFIFSMISFIILTSGWLYIASIISFYIKSIFGNANLRSNPILYSVIMSAILEIGLAAISIILKPTFSQPLSSGAGIISGLEKGSDTAILISPITSIIGAVIGVKKRKNPWKIF